MFIKLKEIDSNCFVHIMIDKIAYLCFNEHGDNTSIGLGYENRLFVKEKPEEIIELINRAKFSDLLDQEIAKPIKKRTKK